MNLRYCKGDFQISTEFYRSYQLSNGSFKYPSELLRTLGAFKNPSELFKNPQSFPKSIGAFQKPSEVDYVLSGHCKRSFIYPAQVREFYEFYFPFFFCFASSDGFEKAQMILKKLREIVIQTK